MNLSGRLCGLGTSIRVGMVSRRNAVFDAFF